jgi:hypothetical protein
MAAMTLLVILVASAACALVGLAMAALQHDEHRRNGLLPGPDPRTATSALLDAVLGAVPVRRVRHGGLAFEDGSGILLERADRVALAELVRLAAARDVVLERVYQLTEGLRLVFRGGDRRLFVDVGALQLVAATP